MPIRTKHVLGFILAVALAIGGSYLSQLAINGSFEVSHPAYWTHFILTYRLLGVLGPPVIVGSIFERRAGFVGGRVAAVAYCYFAWPMRQRLYTEFGEVALQACFTFLLDGLIYIVLMALMAAFVGWLRFKWYPRSRFADVKLRLIFVFLAILAIGGDMVFKGVNGLHDEYRLKTAGIPARVTRMFQAWGDEDVAVFLPERGQEFSMDNELPQSLRDRFNRGEPVSIRMVPDNPGIYSWEGQDRSDRVLIPCGLVFAGLLSMAMGMLFWRCVRR